MWLGLFVVAAAGLAACDDSAYDRDGGELVAEGWAFVQQRGCPTCHQDLDGTLSGQSTPRPGTTAYPHNLTSDPATGLGAWADIEIVRALRYGFDPDDNPLCPPMPRFDGTDPGQPFMTDLEASAIVAYLRSLPAVQRARPPSYCPPLKSPPGDMAMSSSNDDLAVPDLSAPPDLGEPPDGGADGGA
jgi:hypothetical protein